MGVVSNLTKQEKPAAAVLFDLYTVPVGRRANIKLWVTNQDAAAADFWRVAIAPLGAANDPEQYIVYDEPLGLSGAVACSDERTGIRLGATDVLRVRSLNGDVSFVATVYEEDA